MSEQLQSVACGNILLSRLPVHERNAAERCFETGSFVAGDLLMRANRPSDYVFFPLDSVISLVRTLDDGSTIELGLVGNEGMIGIDVFLEGGIQRSDAIVQSAGSVYRMASDDLLRRPVCLPGVLSAPRKARSVTPVEGGSTQTVVG